MNNKCDAGNKAWLAAIAISLACHQAHAVDVKFNEWLEKVSISGDWRLREEHFEKATEGQINRHRQRFRLRLVSDFSLPHFLEAKFRFASGTGEQVSTNQSFDNLSSQKGIWIDRAYLQWSPRPYVRFSGGRVANPFWTVTTSDMVRDDDFNPEGFSQSLEFLLPANMRAFINALQMVADEDSGSNQDQWMIGQQLGVDFLLPFDIRTRLAGAYYNWVHAEGGTFSQNVTNEGNRRTGAAPGTLQNAFGVAEATLQASGWIADLPLSGQATVIQNTRSRLDPAEDAGYQIGGKLGQALSRQSWEVAYFYKFVETDATVADVSDSDFGDGGTNRKGSMVWAAYNPEEWFQIKSKYSMTKVINESLSGGQDTINRFQLDLSVKF